MLDKLTRIFPRGGEKKLLNHVAISLEGGGQEELYINNESELYERKGKLIQEILAMQIKLKIPIVSLFILSNRLLAPGFSIQIQNSLKVLQGLDLDFIQKHQIKVSPIGKWYELPGKAVEEMKMLIEETKDYDKFFLNLCIYYDGKDEILDACKMIARRVAKQMLTPEELTKETISDNLYSSNFLPPDIIIINDSLKLTNFLLWDSGHSDIILTKLSWPEFNGGKFKEIVKKWK